MTVRKAFFFDIDGTLVPQDSMELPAEAVCRDIDNLKQQGHLCFLCTGRPLCDVSPALLGMGFDGIISAAGARIQMGSRVLYERYLPKELLRQTAALLIENHLSGLLEGTSGFYLVGQGQRRVPWEFPRIDRPEDLTGEEQIGLFTIRPDSPQVYESVREFMETHFEIYFTAEDYRYEMGLPGQNKADAIRRICQILNFSIADTVAFGDSENDAAMLDTVGQGIAMENAPQWVREKACLVAPPVAENGICRALRQLGYV